MTPDTTSTAMLWPIVWRSHRKPTPPPLPMPSSKPELTTRLLLAIWDAAWAWWVKASATVGLNVMEPWERTLTLVLFLTTTLVPLYLANHLVPLAAPEPTNLAPPTWTVLSLNASHKLAPAHLLNIAPLITSHS